MIIPYMKVFPGEPLVLVVSMAEDKDHKGILAALRGAAPKAIIFTSVAIAGAQTRCARPAGLTEPAVFMLACVELSILVAPRDAAPKVVLTSVAIAGAQTARQVYKPDSVCCTYECILSNVDFLTALRDTVSNAHIFTSAAIAGASPARR